MNNEKLFVYGSLMRGMRYHESYLGDWAVQPIEATTYGKLVHIAEQRTAAMLEGNKTIKGEVVEIPHKALGRLDYLHGVRDSPHQSEFCRVKRGVTIRGMEIQAWVYMTTAEKLRSLEVEFLPAPGGDWREFYNDLLAIEAEENRKKYPII